jgi:hypothetical protein
MPKKYRVELSLVEDASGRQLEGQTVSEYDTEPEAREGFREKVNVTRDRGSEDRNDRA